ncbi:pathogenesis-related protein 1C-like [Chenopodium quinoa]|uniref:SCP domain-containing protein n=1 Tax=Chenopodium quinoa TaxID=63459 RepID=A0A803N5Y3_CHEQI|nr:pathogenesis-related protein 1C-like [Chenopodium quinoa]
MKYHPWRRHGSLSHEFLLAHNNVRAKYGMPPLIWDKRLAHYARRHASKLVGNCSMVHSVGQYGENLFWGKLEHWTPSRIVEDWAKESEFFDLKGGKCTKDWTECGHFTQIIWADTTRVGCNRLKCVGSNKGYIGICNYDPPGNVVNQSPFIRNIKSSAVINVNSSQPKFRS